MAVPIIGAIVAGLAAAGALAMKAIALLAKVGFGALKIAGKFAVKSIVGAGRGMAGWARSVFRAITRPLQKIWRKAGFKDRQLKRSDPTKKPRGKGGFFDIPGGYPNVPTERMDSIRLRFNVDTSEMYQAIENLRVTSASFRLGVNFALRSVAQDGVAWIRRNYLSGRPGLKRQSGTLANSLTSVVQAGNIIFGTAGSKYASAHRGMTIHAKAGRLAIPTSPAMKARYGDNLQGAGLRMVLNKYLTPKKKLWGASAITHTLVSSVRIPNRFDIREAAARYLNLPETRARVTKILGDQYVKEVRRRGGRLG